MVLSLPTSASPVEAIPVAFNSLGVHRLIIDRVDVALPVDQIASNEVNAEYIQPLILEVEKHFLNESVLLDLMSCCFFFKTQAESGSPSKRKLMAFRAAVAEEIASQISHDLEGIHLARALIYEFYPLNQGDTAYSMTVPHYYRTSALDLAIKTKAYDFLMEQPIANTVSALWDGTIVIERGLSHNGAIMSSDTVTDVRQNNTGHSPGYTFVLQIVSAAIYLVLYLMLIQEDPQRPAKIIEVLFALWSLGYMLDEYNQMLEFGTQMYFMSLWNWIDCILVAHSVLYFTFRALSLFNHGYNLLARGVLITAGLFIVPRLFSVFDNNKVFSSMIFSLQRVSSDLVVSWCIVMLFSVGVWVSVAFSRPRVRLSSLQDEEGNGASRTALAMFKMLFGDNDSLWDRWFRYTTFDKIALGFYLVLAQFIMPTVVTAVLTTSFARIRADSEKEYYFMRTVQTMQKLKSNRKELASQTEVSPINFISWVFEWFHYLLPDRAYGEIANTSRAVVHYPGEVGKKISDRLRWHRADQASILSKERKQRLHDEVERTMGNNDVVSRKAPRRQERRTAKYALIGELFTNEKLKTAFEESPVARELATENEQETSKTVLTRLVELEKSNARIEKLLSELVKS